MTRHCSQRQLEALRRGREKLRHKRTKKTTGFSKADEKRWLALGRNAGKIIFPPH